MDSRPTTFSHRLPGALLCLLVGLSATGCGDGLATVSGKVTYKNAPLKSGSVQFQDSDAVTYTAKIESDGTYTTRVKPGEAKVLISSTDEEEALKYADAIRAGRGAKRGAKPAEGGKPMVMPTRGASLSLIPKKYADFSTSGLAKTIKRGKNADVDFDLTD